MKNTKAHLRFIELKVLDEQTKRSLYHLWNKEYPTDILFENMADFTLYLQGLGALSHTVVRSVETGALIGWYFSFNRDDERWFAIIIDSSWHRLGIGNHLLNRAKECEPVLNGWVIDHDDASKNNGRFYRSPLAFYLKNGFKVMPNKRLETAKISAVKIRWNRGV